MTPFLRSIALLALVCSAQALTARELYWRELDVTATLDESAALQVSERHGMVFTGDWNGGERKFNLEHGETISIRTITRIDQPGGTPILLQEGGLDVVDHWAWVNPTTIRWRSRTPGSPAFNNTPIDYIIEYTTTNVLRPSLNRSTYTLKHDFAFPEREGEIRIFRLRFDLDSSWRAVEGGPVTITTGPLPPGRSFIVNVAVVNAVGAGPGLAGVLSDRTDVLGRALMVALALLGVTILWLRFLKLERNNGRYVPIATENVTWSWLDAHSKDLLPEVAAAIYSGNVDDSAVAATLARLTAEGRIASWTTEKDVLHLELRQPIENFVSYERKLMDEVFFGGVTSDTRSIREHYRTFGFKPALTIKSGVNERIRNLIQEDRPRSGNFGVIAFGAFVAAVIAFVWMVRTTSEISATAVTVMVGASIAGAVVLYRAAAAGQIEANVWRDDMDSAARSTRAFMMAPALGIVLTIIVAVLAPGGTTGVAFTGVFACLALSAAGIVLQGGNSVAGPRRRLWENRLRKLRYFLSDEVHQRTPIEDRYVPYLVAFGLEQRPSMTVVAPSSPVITTREDPHVSSAGQPSSHAVRAAASDSSGVSSAPAAAYAAGGGAFGGAGASGSWAAAASSLAAGVDRPVSSSGRGSDWKSSSSDHSTSSNNNSSSGGGGGGGW